MDDDVLLAASGAASGLLMAVADPYVGILVCGVSFSGGGKEMLSPVRLSGPRYQFLGIDYRKLFYIYSGLRVVHVGGDRYPLIVIEGAVNCFWIDSVFGQGENARSIVNFTPPSIAAAGFDWLLREVPETWSDGMVRSVPDHLITANVWEAILDGPAIDSIPQYEFWSAPADNGTKRVRLVFSIVGDRIVAIGCRKSAD